MQYTCAQGKSLLEYAADAVKDTLEEPGLLSYLSLENSFLEKFHGQRSLVGYSP